jgi:hypothetical protein
MLFVLRNFLKLDNYSVLVCISAGFCLFVPATLTCGHVVSPKK